MLKIFSILKKKKKTKQNKTKTLHNNGKSYISLHSKQPINFERIKPNRTEFQRSNSSCFKFFMEIISNRTIKVKSYILKKKLTKTNLNWWNGVKCTKI